MEENGTILDQIDLDEWELNSLDIRITKVPDIILKLKESVNQNLTDIISFKDCTFLIPYSYDTKDRLENLYITYLYLYRNILCNDIIIYEYSEKNKPTFNSKVIDNINFKFIKEPFIKTKMINKMVREVRTKWFCIYDSDIFLTKEQLSETSKLINSDLKGNFLDCIIPYDGVYQEMPRKFIDFYLKDLDKFKFKNFDSDHSLGHRFSRKDYVGTGGCVFFKTSSFLEIGGMNENFVKWGFEDDEVIYRMGYLGKNIFRLNNHGPIHHIQHASGNFGHDHFHENGENQQKEYMKIKSMTHGELWKEIESWKK